MVTAARPPGQATHRLMGSYCCVLATHEGGGREVGRDGGNDRLVSVISDSELPCPGDVTHELGFLHDSQHKPTNP